MFKDILKITQTQYVLKKDKLNFNILTLFFIFTFFIFTSVASAQSILLREPLDIDAPYFKMYGCKSVGKHNECYGVDENESRFHLGYKLFTYKTIDSQYNDYNRTWFFMQPGYARQNIRLEIMDAPTGYTSDFRNSYFYFFPRNYLYDIKVDGPITTVTIPTGESIEFDNETGRIVGGVFTELELKNHPGHSADIQYTGSGGVIRVDRRAADPRLKTNAVVTWQGKTCTIKSKEFWPDQTNDSRLNFRFKTDEELMEFLKQKCHF